MIGTRRALGATAAQIRQYFQMENLLITSLGVWLGIGGAYGINAVLMSQHEVSRLPWFYVPASALVLVVLGQIAVWPWPQSARACGGDWRWCRPSCTTASSGRTRLTRT